MGYLEFSIFSFFYDMFETFKVQTVFHFFFAVELRSNRFSSCVRTIEQVMWMKQERSSFVHLVGNCIADVQSLLETNCFEVYQLSEGIVLYSKGFQKTMRCKGYPSTHTTMRHCQRVSGVFSNRPFPRRT